METGEWLTRWTVRLAVGCYLARLLVDVGCPPTRSRLRFARGLWTAGCLLYLAHVAAAFHVYHQWSHTEAYRFTARQTHAVTGLDWGGGLYVNYLFTAAWLADVVAWWRRGPDYPQRNRGVSWAIQAVFAFIVFNATVVFGPPPWRWVAAVFAVMLILAVWRRLGEGERGASAP